MRTPRLFGEPKLYYRHRATCELRAGLGISVQFDDQPLGVRRIVVDFGDEPVRRPAVEMTKRAQNHESNTAILRHD